MKKLKQTFYFIFLLLANVGNTQNLSSDEIIQFLNKSLVEIDKKVIIKDALFPEGINIDFKKALFLKGRLSDAVIFYPTTKIEKLPCDSNLAYYGDVTSFPLAIYDIVDVSTFSHKIDNIELGLIVITCEENSVKYFNVAESGENCENGTDKYAYYFYRKDIKGQKEKVLNAFINLSNNDFEATYGKQLSFETTCEFLKFVDDEIYKNKFAWHEQLKNSNINDRFYLTIKDIDVTDVEVQISWDDTKVSKDFSVSTLDKFESVHWEIKTSSQKESYEILKKLSSKSIASDCGGGMINKSYSNSDLDFTYDIRFGDNLSGFYLDSFEGRIFHSSYNTEEFNNINFWLYNPEVKTTKYYYITQQKANEDFHLQIRNAVARAESDDLSLYIKDKNINSIDGNYKLYPITTDIPSTKNNRVAFSNRNSEDDTPFYIAFIDIKNLTTVEIAERFKNWKQYISYALGSDYEIIQEKKQKSEVYTFSKVQGNGAIVELKRFDNADHFEIHIKNY